MKRFIILMSVVLLVSSCKDKNGKSIFLPPSSGNPYEMLVVMDKDLYESPSGRALHDVLTSDVPGLPQSEPQFRISQVNNSKFDGPFRIFRNIIVVNINPDMYTTTKFKFIRDLNSEPQMIMTINSPSLQEFSDYVYSHGQTIIDFFVRSELNREIKQLEEKHENNVEKVAKDMFGCTLWVPKDLSLIKKGKDFFWCSSPASNLLNFCMYSYPYTSYSDFTRENFIHKRDSVMKVNIQGARDSMWMATQYFRGEYLAESKDIVVRGEFAQEVRGLWEMTKDNMGGPFVSHVRVDTVNQRVIVAEGFVYFPREPKKRNYMRRLEAALYTLQLPSDKGEALGKEELEEETDTESLKSSSK